MSDLATFLRQADKFVKTGQYDDALDQIQKAQKINPNNPYAKAYEEHVRSIIISKQNEKPKDPPAKPDPKDVAKDQVSREQNLIETDRSELDEQKILALQKKVEALLLSAREYYKQQQYKIALDEITRAHIIDPANQQATKLEAEIRTAQDEALQREKEERARREKEDELNRKEYLESELNRIKKEEEERKRKTEEDRKKIQQEKIDKHLIRAENLCDDGYLDDALAELGFVVTIDPLNDKAKTLEQRIRKAEEERKAEAIKKREREKEAQLRAQNELREKINNHIEEANTLGLENRFSEALHLLSSAFVLDPLNSDLQKAEDNLIKARTEWMKTEEEREQKEEEEKKRKQEEEIQSIIENAMAQVKNEEESGEEKNEKVNEYLNNARSYLKEENFESALAEIALAVATDPFNKDIDRIESEILEAHEIRLSSTADKTSDSGEAKEKEYHTFIGQFKKLVTGWTTKEDKPGSSTEQNLDDKGNGNGEDTGLLQNHIYAAEEFLKKQEIDRALEELAEAVLIDPLNEDVARLEKRIRDSQEK